MINPANIEVEYNCHKCNRYRNNFEVIGYEKEVSRTKVVIGCTCGNYIGSVTITEKKPKRKSNEPLTFTAGGDDATGSENQERERHSARRSRFSTGHGALGDPGTNDPT